MRCRRTDRAPRDVQRAPLDRLFGVAVGRPMVVCRRSAVGEGDRRCRLSPTFSMGRAASAWRQRRFSPAAISESLGPAPGRSAVSPKATSALLGVCLLFLLCLVGSGVTLAGPPSTALNGNHAPAPGTAERRAILDALRDEVRRRHQLEVVFVVAELTVIGDWAWIWTRPESPDGRNHYEDVGGLLHRERGRWRVVEYGADAVETLKQRHPDMPDALLNRK